MPDPVDELLAVIELCGRDDRLALALWACDCASRPVHHAFEVEHHDDRRPRIALRLVRDHLRGRASSLDEADRLVRAALDDHADWRGRSAEVVLEVLACVQGSRAATEVAGLCAAYMSGDHNTDGARLRADERRWQARRLLWRVGMMPRLPDMLVRLDHAEARGLTPRMDSARGRRFDALRGRIHAEEDARLDLLVEFPEAMFARELSGVESGGRPS